MSDRRRGLGKGLGALIPTGAPAAPTPAPESRTATGPVAEAARVAAARTRAPLDRHLFGGGPPGGGREAASEQHLTPVAGARLAEIPLAAITPNPKQPRQVFEEETLTELVQSLREVGVLQPIIVRPLVGAGGGDAVNDAEYELVMGERRWRAAQLAGLETIPAIVRATDDDVMLLDALLENLHRAALNPLEEAAAYDQLLSEFACTHESLAARIGRSRSQITNTVRLLKLPPTVQRKVAAGVLSAGHARALLAVPDPADAEHLAHRIVAENLSVRAVEELVAIGETAAPATRKPREQRPMAPELDDLAASLADRWDTRVKVQLGRNRGKLVVEFASVEDLERIVALMSSTAVVNE